MKVKRERFLAILLVSTLNLVSCGNTVSKNDDLYGTNKLVILFGFHGTEAALNTYVSETDVEVSQCSLHLRRDYITSNDYHMDSAEWFKRRE